jgi:hypothetical protein
MEIGWRDLLYWEEDQRKKRRRVVLLDVGEDNTIFFQRQGKSRRAYITIWKIHIDKGEICDTFIDINRSKNLLFLEDVYVVPKGNNT